MTSPASTILLRPARYAQRTESWIARDEGGLATFADH
jgi:hypothetical protein